MKLKLVLHICCAPDEAWVVSALSETYDLRCFFCNPNIQPQEEYEKRLWEAKKVAARFRVPFDSSTYDPRSWEMAVEHFVDTPEGGSRCEQCFSLRLRMTARYCETIAWPHFTTVMSLSPHKNIDMLNKAGKEAAESFKVVYEPFNFKKNNGFQKSIQLSKELGLYRQDYCGCRLSKAESEERKRKKES
jgi:predicted adenine nucleotide alpha hydrolase (AANH) superfamily ATPase